MNDLQKKIIRFVGIPDKRVKEDYLRILRYFRFYSRVKDNCTEHHKESLEAIRKNVDGLKSKIKKKIFILINLIKFELSVDKELDTSCG